MSKKDYQEIISDLNNSDFGTIHGINIVFNFLLKIDPVTISTEEDIEIIYGNLARYFEENKIRLMYALSDTYLIMDYFHSKDIEEIINFLKKAEIFKINQLLLNYLLKSRNDIYCEFDKEIFMDNQDYPAYSDLVLSMENEVTKPLIDFNNPVINTLEYLTVCLYFMIENKGLSDLSDILEYDDLDSFLNYLAKNNIDLKKNTKKNIKIILDIIKSGARLINDYLNSLSLDLLLYKVEPKEIIISALISNNCDIFNFYYRKYQKLIKLEDILLNLMFVENEMFVKAYAIVQFNDIDFIYANGYEISLDDKKSNANMNFFIKQNNVDINRTTKNINLMSYILINGNLSLIKKTLEIGGNLFFNIGLYSDGVRFFDSMVYTRVVLNKNIDCVHFILDKVTSQNVYHDISIVFLLLINDNVTLLEEADRAGLLDHNQIKSKGKFFINYSISNNSVNCFKYLISNIFSPNNVCANGLTVLHNVVIEKNDTMLDYLLEFKNLIYNPRIKNKTPGDYAIENNYIYGVKRLIEKKGIFQDTSFNSPIINLWVSKKKQPEVYQMLKDIMPKGYKLKLFFQIMFFLIVLTGCIILIILGIKNRWLF